MKVYSLIAQKGGSGKSTLAANLSVLPKEKSVVIDTDPQHSLADWFEARPDEKSTPEFIAARSEEVRNILTAAKEQGFRYAFIDTPGRDMPSMRAIAELSDTVIVPCQPSGLDIWAIDRMELPRKKSRLIINHGFSAGKRNTKAIELLRQIGETSPTPIVRRAAYQDAMALGLGVTELEPRGKASKEIRELWEWLK